MFNASYFPELRIEACFYEKLKVNPVLKAKYETNVRAVNIKKATEGFYSKTVVALFPENHIGGIQLKSDSIYYFINKFVDRFFNITQKMVSKVVEDDFFKALSLASNSEISEAAVYWVWLHEFHHRQGFLPIPEYLRIKTIKPLAGLEEMRVDVASIITCMEDGDLPRKQAEFVSKFIFAERLLRYSIEGAINPNYDAIASQLLFCFLQQHGGIVVKGMSISITKNWFHVLKKLALTIEAIEAGIEQKSEEKVQQELLNFTKQYTNFNTTSQEFNHIQYFKKIKTLYNL